MKRIISMLLLATLAGCAVVDARPDTYKTADQVYQFTGKKALGIMSRRITIYANGRQIMRGAAHYWVHRIVLTGTLDGQPILAVCGETGDGQNCRIQLSDTDIANITF